MKTAALEITLEVFFYFHRRPLPVQTDKIIQVYTH